MKRLVVLVLLVLGACKAGDPIPDGICPFSIKLSNGREFVVPCPVEVSDGGVDSSDATDGSSESGEAESSVLDASDSADVVVDVNPDIRVDARMDAPVDSGNDVREASVPTDSASLDSSSPVEASTPVDAAVLDSSVTPPAQIKGMNDIGFWRGGVNRVALRTSMVNAKTKYARIPFASFAADAPGGIDTAAWRQKVSNDFLAVGITPIPVAFSARSGAEATCSPDPNVLAQVVNDWVADAPWLKTTKVILNIANEWGPGDPGAGANDPGLAVWRDSYITAIQRIRSAGISVPLLIDAPGCGQDAYGVEKFGGAVAAADPLHSVIFSIHVYASFWTTGVAQSWQLNLAQHFDLLRATNLPIVIGEFSAAEFNVSVGPGLVDPATVIAGAVSHGFGWLAWQAYNDSLENVFSGPNNAPLPYPPASNLTAFGAVVINALSQ